MKRTFIATKIHPGTQLLNAYAKLRNELENEKIKWVDPENFHLTLFFIGDTDEEQIDIIRQELASLTATYSKTHIQLEGLGVFKSIHKPRVLWAGISQYDELKKIKIAIDQRMEQFGFTPDKREFKPHLTLARMKWIEDKQKLNQILNEFKSLHFQESTIEDLILFESILKPTGPEYKPIEKFELH
mgnify:CR=1 FL=1